jgi:hypothetical protein
MLSESSAAINWPLGKVFIGAPPIEFSALGQKRSHAVRQRNVRYGSEADSCSAATHVR